jgi:cation diffusion facilitator family transporter
MRRMRRHFRAAWGFRASGSVLPDRRCCEGHPPACVHAGMRTTERIAAGSIAVGLAVLGLKTAAWAVTGSAALFSDAAESVVNVVAAIVALIALRFAAMPADQNHPYGHDKAEFFAAVIEGVLILLAAFTILDHAWNAYTHPAPIETPLRGMVLNGIATVLNLGWAMVLIRQGRAHRSPALSADGRHLLSDVVTSAGVLFGVGLVVVTGQQWLDPLLAAATAVYILVSGAAVIRDSVGGLMDAAPAADIVDRIRALVGQHAEGAIEAHDLRTRHAGRLTFLEFHLVVPGAMSVSEAHAICDRIEAALKAEVQGLMITIHVEPEGKAKHRGVIVL